MGKIGKFGAQTAASLERPVCVRLGPHDAQSGAVNLSLTSGQLAVWIAVLEFTIRREVNERRN